MTENNSGFVPEQPDSRPLDATRSRLDPRRLRVHLRVRPRLDARGQTPHLSPVSANRPPRIAGSLLRLSIALALVYGTLGGGLLYWQVMQAHSLTTDAANPIVLAAARDAPRGTIYASNGDVLAENAAGNQRQRQYPYEVAAPVVGYNSTIFGTAGLEKSYDAQLTGLGSLNGADDLLRKFQALAYNPSDLHTSLDISLQESASELLGDQHGAVVAIEPATGRVLALVSSPTYDPNKVVDPRQGRSYVASLQSNTDSPLLNRATQGLYVPGSVFKIVTATAGLSSGSITPDTTYADQPGEIQTGFLVDGFRIHDFPRKVQTDHPLDFYEATEVSDNIWFAHAGLATGPMNLLQWASAYGFGQRIPFELPTSPSQVTDGGGSFGGFQDRVELANAAYGQAEVLVTPLQMALVAATIANHGLEMQPKLVDYLQASDGTVTQMPSKPLTQVCDASVASVIGQAMQQAVEGQYGKAFAGAAKVPGVPTAGKSGTAQLGGNAAPHSWFIGYAPADNPKIAIAVIVEGGGAGSQRAVPLAGQLMSEYLAENP
ncbi:MAG TPA: penicillin-binding transpeptidase domain-containing protein [Candidatus Limnocylindrales bacterium]|jgi:peptidoglycan glycosyltransferase